MKKIRPVHEYTEAEAYPMLERTVMERRRFWRAALVGAASLGGALMVSCEKNPARGAKARGKLDPELVPKSRTPRKQENIKIPLHHTSSGCSLEVAAVNISTDNKQLASFLRSHTEQDKLRDMLRLALGQVACRQLVDKTQRKRVVEHVGLCLIDHYRARTGRRAPMPQVVLTTMEKPTMLGLVLPPEL